MIAEAFGSVGVKSFFAADLTGDAIVLEIGVAGFLPATGFGATGVCILAGAIFLATVFLTAFGAASGVIFLTDFEASGVLIFFAREEGGGLPTPEERTRRAIRMRLVD